MDRRFYNSYFDQQPFQSRYPPALRKAATAAMKPSIVSKVVSIPVHFIESEQRRSSSASKIQKVFMGFLVRKNMKKIISIMREVDEVERRISRAETMELVRRDEKERLRINETLMALLLKLDSVRGVDSGVRDCRRSAINKVIALQEKLDDTVAHSNESDTKEDNAKYGYVAEGSVDQTPEIKETVDLGAGQPLENEDSVNSGPNLMDPAREIEGKESAIQHGANVSTYNDQDLTLGMEDSMDLGPGQPLGIKGSSDFGANVMDPALEIEGEVCATKNDANVSADGDQNSTLEIKASVNSRTGQLVRIQDSTNSRDSVVDDALKIEGKVSQIEHDANVSENIDMDLEVEERMHANGVDDPKLVTEWDSLERSSLDCPENFGLDIKDSGAKNEEEDCVVKQVVEDQGMVDFEAMTSDTRKDEAEQKNGEMGDGGVETGKEETKELLGRVVGENRQLMSMMKQLCEKNQAQTRLLSSLTQRVEQLEKAFISEKSRRRRKKNEKKRGAKGVIDGFKDF